MAQAKTLTLVMLAVSAAVLAGCSSSVKLDEVPVETRVPVVKDATATNKPNTASQTAVATVDLSAKNANAAANADAMAMAGLARVIYFDFDSFSVKDDYRATVEGHAKVLAGQRSKRIVIEGHTDERGGREYNLALGQKRAEAVQRSLTLLGAAAEQIEAVSYGEERPASTGSNEDAWAKNRRAELKDR
ncbi:MAG: peptidoglycan-associated lipoprotein Pal [Ideonella sp. MAG2]|nr:MAG: peptidoglycan-associated lipoprotein Pal [Ideonella sp. MAG2]